MILSFTYKCTNRYKGGKKRLKVENSLSKTLKSAKIPKSIVDEYLHQLSYTLDFQRDVKNGDTIELLYEANFTKNNSIVGKPYFFMDLCI